MDQAKRVALGYARGRGKIYDRAFIDECIAEAYFTIVDMLWTAYQNICEKYPVIEDRHKFLRMSVGYKLKEYWAYRATSTISFLKKKGIEPKHWSIQEEDSVTYYTELDEHIALEHATRDEVERRVVELYSIGNDRELIAYKLSMTPRRVRRILIRVKKRLLRA